MAATSAKVPPGPDHVQDVFSSAGTRLEHPHQPLAHHEYAGARFGLAENPLSFAELAEPGDGGQPLETGRPDLGKQAATLKNVDDVHVFSRKKGRRPFPAQGGQSPSNLRSVPGGDGAGWQCNIQNRRENWDSPLETSPFFRRLDPGQGTALPDRV